MADDMTLDEFLAVQPQESKPLATIEAVDGKPELVKISPWVNHTGCLCHLALIIPRNLITSVKSHGETHSCCGRQLRIVEVNFAKDAQISLSEVFSQFHSFAGDKTVPPSVGTEGHGTVLTPMVGYSLGEERMAVGNCVHQNPPPDNSVVIVAPGKNLAVNWGGGKRKCFKCLGNGIWQDLGFC